MKTPVEIVLEQIKLPFELRGYQGGDIDEYALRPSCGLFHGLGLGKTIISTMIGCYKIIEKGYDSCTVLCPEPLITQWCLFLESLNLNVLAYRGTPKEREKMSFEMRDFILMSYQIFQRDYDKVKSHHTYYIVDEGTVLCNTQNLMHKMLEGGRVRKVKKVPGQIKPKITWRTFNKIHTGMAILSATPVNKPTDAFGLIKILSPGLYDSYSQFERVHVAEYDYFDQPKEYENLDMLQENLMANAVMRHPSDHLDLPPLIFKTIEYDLAPKHKKLYDKLLEEKFLELEDGTVLDALQATALYHAAQRVIMNPDELGLKSESVGVEIVDGLVKSVEQFMLFNNYRATNRMFMGRYEIGGIFSELSSKKKDESIRRFQAGEEKGLTSHVKSGGVGLNLQGCQIGIFPELPVTSRDIRQAVGRMHRSGQKKSVIITVLAARGTIQTTLMRRLIERDEVISQVITNPRSLAEDLLANVERKNNKKKETKKSMLKALQGK